MDDDAGARDVTRDLLAVQGYTIFVASGGAEAAEMAPAVGPDVIISDLMMPGIDGIQLCGLLRSLPETRATPIIVLTALDSRNEMLRALEAGATDFLTKPVRGVELRARVRSMMHVANEHRLLQQLLRMRTDLTHMALHDMRNPLLGMKLAMDVLARRMTDASAMPILDRLRGGAMRLQNLIDQILITAKSDEGQLHIDNAPVDVAKLLPDVAADLRTLAEQAKVEIRVEPGPPISVDGDRSLLGRCVENLLTNAIKFSPPGGHVEMAVSADDHVVRIDVADQGPGVPEHKRELIFQRYTVADAPQGIPQFGLGLAFCRLVADAHDGAVEVLPRSERGSIFRLTLPQRRSAT